jgi:hypothetical protein
MKIRTLCVDDKLILPKLLANTMAQLQDATYLTDISGLSLNDFFLQSLKIA